MFNTTLAVSNISWKSRNFTTVTIDDSSLPSSEIILTQLCHGLLGTIGFLENVAVVMVILFNKSRILLDFPSNWFVLSLAVIDALTCVVINLVVNIYFIAGRKIDILVTMVRFVAHCTSGNLFVLTLNRFLSVYNCLRYPAIMTVSRAKRLVLLPWVIGLLLCPLYEYSRWAKLPDMTYVGGAYYGTIILSITALNIYILKQARDKSKKIKELEMAVLGKRTESSMKDYRLVIRLLIVSLTFFSSAIIFMVSARQYQNEEIRRSLSFKRNFIWCSTAMQFNAIIDPVVYSINHPIFTKYMNKIRSRLSRRNKVCPSGAVAIYRSGPAPSVVLG